MGKFDLYKLTYTFIFITLFSGCNRIDPDPYLNPEITIENNKITSRYCLGFGSRILTDRDQVLIRGDNSIYIFQIGGSKIELIQTIDFNLSTGITGMAVHNSTLAFGTSEKEMNVFIYERIGDSWVFKQEIKGTTEETFGVSIDIDENYMMIGAPATSPFHSSGYKKGKVYIYHKTNEGWIKECDFLSPEPKPDDYFGLNVAIYNNLLLAGSNWMEGIPVYKYDGTLTLLKTNTTVGLEDLTHYNNSFIFYEIDDSQIRSFKLEENGDFTYCTVDCDFDGKLGLDGFGCLAIRDSLSLVAMRTSEYCYLLEYVNNKWSEKMAFRSDIEDPYYVQGLAITDDYIILGGLSITSDYSYVRFISY